MPGGLTARVHTATHRFRRPTISTPQRDTRQRRAIRRALSDAGRPLTPQEVLDASRAQCPGLGIATVYRALKGLVEEGWLSRVELPGTPDRFERAGKAHHHHFHCRDCQRVFEVDNCHEGIPLLPPEGFVVEDHEVVFYGRCPDCVAGHGKPDRTELRASGPRCPGS